MKTLFILIIGMMTNLHAQDIHQLLEDKKYDDAITILKAESKKTL